MTSTYNVVLARKLITIAKNLVLALDQPPSLKTSPAFQKQQADKKAKRELMLIEALEIFNEISDKIKAGEDIADPLELSRLKDEVKMAFKESGSQLLKKDVLDKIGDDLFVQLREGSKQGKLPSSEQTKDMLQKRLAEAKLRKIMAELDILLKDA